MVRKLLLALCCILVLAFAYSLPAEDVDPSPESPQVWIVRSGLPIGIVWEHRPGKWYAGNGADKVSGPFPDRKAANKEALRQIRLKWD